MRHKVYFCHRLTDPSAATKCTNLRQRLPDSWEAYIPNDAMLESHESFYEVDRQQLDESDIVFVVGDVGTDCAWEIGYAMARRKHVVIFIDKSNRKTFIKERHMWDSYDKIYYVQHVRPRVIDTLFEGFTLVTTLLEE